MSYLESFGPARTRPAAGRTRRVRLAACTALVLAAGALLAPPATAEDHPAPGRALRERVAPPAAAPRLTPSAGLLKERAAARTGAAAEDRKAGRTGAAAVPKPRFDLTGDGFSEGLYRGFDGVYRSVLSDRPENPEFALRSRPGEQLKDVVPLGDPDADGNPDLLTVSFDGTLSAYTAQGTSGTGPAVWSGRGWAAYNKVVVPGDLTGDGRNDLLARTPGGELYLYRGKTSLTDPFAGRVRLGTGWAAYDQLVGVPDSDGDGVADLYARTPAGELYFYPGSGNPVAPFRARVRVGTGWGVYNQIFSIDDLDGDGRADLIGRKLDGTLLSYRATTHGALAAATRFGSGWSVPLLAGTGGNPDFGKQELLGLDTKGTLWEYWSAENGRLSARYQLSDVGGFQGAKVLHTSSLDGDGRADLLEVYAGRLYRHTPEGPVELGSGWGAFTALVGPGDLSGDGRGDLLARTSGGVLYLYRGDGTGRGLGSRVALGAGWNAYDKLVGAGDMTGDGRDDLLARTPGGALYLYAGTGSASAPFRARVLIGSGWQAYAQLAAPGDLTGDGRADLVAATPGGTLYRYTATGGAGTAVFSPRVSLGTGWNTYRGLH
ncbi:VCBS repeat-containing protein [Streptomyces sp. LP05-1]|uniref:VCBS repeat-containing protein n=1 Tax=Streptomyces pyxinae TaxID=2970734 RepID=A0ABT2CMM4_9ACTN|nr:VCBS repeat-containing protein [Streptomyces sp. LP05-1]MCS0637834.1 VCBS repeat-containing protein [Streptomyces sp. LP05-1]